MMWNGRQVKAYAYTAPVDMRKGFDGLMAVVEQKLGRNPLSGELFLFVSRNLIRAKVLYWDGTGLCVFARYFISRPLVAKDRRVTSRLIQVLR